MSIEYKNWIGVYAKNGWRAWLDYHVMSRGHINIKRERSFYLTRERYEREWKFV